MSANKINPGPPDGDPGPLETLGVNPGPPNDPGSPETFKVDPFNEQQPGPPTGPGGNQLPAVQNQLPAVQSQLPAVQVQPGPPNEPKSRPLFFFSVFLMLLCLLLGVAAILSGAFTPGGAADQPTHEVTEAPVSTEKDKPNVTEPPGDTQTGFCGQTCAAGSACQPGLVCSPNTDPNIQASNACLRNGHCGCGVPCDPNGGSVCDPGLTCTTTGGVSTCWAGGCEVTPTPVCTPKDGDGTCSQCETADTAPQDCGPTPPPDTGGGNKGGGGGGGGNKCTCRTVCSGATCRTICRDATGATCRP